MCQRQRNLGWISKACSRSSCKMEDHLNAFGDSYFFPSNFRHFLKYPQIIQNPLKINGINLIFLLINWGMGNVRGA